MVEPYKMSPAEQAQATYIEELYERNNAQIQVMSRTGNKKWVDCEKPVFNWGWYNYRIKVDDKPTSTIKPEDIPENKVIDYDRLEKENKIMREWLLHIHQEAMVAHNDSTESCEDFPAFAASMVNRCLAQVKKVCDTPTGE